MTKQKIAIVGAGHLGRIHTKLALGNDQFEVIGVADPNPKAREVVEETFEVSTFDDVQTVADSLDAAIIASPTVSHYEITASLLRAGVHCLVEKPLAATADQAYRLVQIANSHGRVLQVGHVERFNPLWTTAQPEMGTPKFIQATRAGPYSGRSTDIGVILDLMIHDLDLILSLDRSEVTSVQASGIAVLGSHEDIAEARIEFASGCIATLRASRIAQTPTRRMQIYSAAGFCDIDFSSDSVQLIQPTPDVLTRFVALDELPAADRLSAKDSIFESLLIPTSVAAPKRNAILDEHNDFLLSVQTGSLPAVTGEDGARAVDVAMKVLSAVQEHAWDGTEFSTMASWPACHGRTSNPPIANR